MPLSVILHTSTDQRNNHTTIDVFFTTKWYENLKRRDATEKCPTAFTKTVVTTTLPAPVGYIELQLTIANCCLEANRFRLKTKQKTQSNVSHNFRHCLIHHHFQILLLTAQIKSIEKKRKHYFHHCRCTNRRTTTVPAPPKVWNSVLELTSELLRFSCVAFRART